MANRTEREPVVTIVVVPRELVEFHCMLVRSEVFERLGATELAAALTATFDEVATTEVPVTLQRAEESSFLVTPASHRVRLRIVVSHLLDRLRRRSSRS